MWPWSLSKWSDHDWFFGWKWEKRIFLDAINAISHQSIGGVLMSHNICLLGGLEAYWRGMTLNNFNNYASWVGLVAYWRGVTLTYIRENLELSGGVSTEYLTKAWVENGMSPNNAPWDSLEIIKWEWLWPILTGKNWKKNLEIICMERQGHVVHLIYFFSESACYAEGYCIQCTLLFSNMSNHKKVF